MKIVFLGSLVASLAVAAGLSGVLSLTDQNPKRKEDQITIHRKDPVKTERVVVQLVPYFVPPAKAEWPVEPSPVQLETPKLAQPVTQPAPLHSSGGQRRGRQDVCQQHGGRRVETHGGRSWHCVFK